MTNEHDAHEDLFWEFEDENYDAFMEHFWRKVVEYAAELNLPVKYVEEEFVIDGELVKHLDC